MHECGNVDGKAEYSRHCSGRYEKLRAWVDAEYLSGLDDIMGLLNDMSHVKGCHCECSNALLHAETEDHCQSDEVHMMK